MLRQLNQQFHLLREKWYNLFSVEIQDQMKICAIVNWDIFILGFLNILRWIWEDFENKKIKDKINN